MRAFCVLLGGLAACGSDPEVAVPAARPPAQVAPPVVVGGHGGVIDALAITADGAAVLSSDGSGARLWPALDATREPIAIALGPIAELRLAHDASPDPKAQPGAAGYVIGVVDPSNGAAIVRVDAEGRVRARVALGAGVAQLELHRGTVLVRRTDHVIDRYAFDGTRRGSIAADPNTHFAKLAIAGEHVMAIVVDTTGTYGRVVTLGDTLAWGTRTAMLPVDPATAVVSPDLKEVAGAMLVPEVPAGALGPAAWPILVNATTGKASERICVIGPDQLKTDPRDRMMTMDRFNGSVPKLLGFVAPGRLACAVSNTIEVFDVRTGRSIAHADASSELHVMAGDVVVGVAGSDLAIARDGETKFLGYDIRETGAARRTAIGIVVEDGPREDPLEHISIVLDEQLRERMRLLHPVVLGTTWTAIEPIDERYYILSSLREKSDDIWGSGYKVSVFEAKSRSIVQELPLAVRDAPIAYEPATSYLATTDAAAALLVHWNATAHRFGEPIQIEAPFFPTRLALLDPALAKGVAALAIREDGGKLDVAEIHLADLQQVARARVVKPQQQQQPQGADTKVKARRAYKLAGQLRSLDRAGRIYLRDPLLGGDVAYVGGVASHVLRGTSKQLVLVPSPDGKRVAGFAESRVVLFDERGRFVWEVAVWGSAGILWSPKGELLVRTAHALAMIDLATGALASRRCGWSLVLSEKVLRDSSSEASLCDVAP